MIQNGRMNNMAEKNDQKVKESVESKMEQFYKKLPELLAIAKKKKNMLGVSGNQRLLQRV